MMESRILFGLLLATLGNLFFYIVSKLVGTYVEDMSKSKKAGSVIAALLMITFYIYMIFYWLELYQESLE